MSIRIVLCCSLVFASTVLVEAQTTPDNSDSQNWRPPGPLPITRIANVAAEVENQTQATPPPVTAVRTSAPSRRGSGTLPNDKGQIWREYDISPYTRGVTSIQKPQQAIIDWVLRETGFEAWHSDTVAILSANSHTLRVYHTPTMQRAVSEIVDRYVSSTARSYMYGLSICTIGHPDWRSRAQKILQPIPVNTSGAEAWLVAREDAATLKEDLARRTDYRNHGSSRLLIANGQTSVITFAHERAYARSRSAPPSGTSDSDGDVGQFTEGIVVELNPLMSLDGQTVDAMIKCSIDQIERLVPVRLETPQSTPGTRQLYNIEVPQIVACRFHERFHWPKDKVLVVSLGIVPRPLPHFVVKNPLDLTHGSDPPRGDMVLIVEHKGDAIQADTADGSAVLKTKNYRGRY